MINIKLISPRYADLRDFLLALPAKMDTEGEYVYSGKRKFDEQEAIGIAMYSRRKFWTKYRKRHKVKFKLEL